jgi:hypothetical protein
VTHGVALARTTAQITASPEAREHNFVHGDANKEKTA